MATYSNDDFFFDSGAAQVVAHVDEGDNIGVITATGMDVTRAGTGRFVWLEIDFSGLSITARFNVENPNEKAVLMSKSELKKCYISVFGADKAAPISALRGRKVRCMLERKISDSGKAYLDIVDYIPMDAPAPVLPPKQTQQRPSQQQSRPPDHYAPPISDDPRYSGGF